MSDPTNLRPFDSMIGRLDRCLSEFLSAAATELDEPDRQTIKHHADDLIGVGKKALELIKECCCYDDPTGLVRCPAHPRGGTGKAQPEGGAR